MVGAAKIQPKNKKVDPERVTWDSTTRHAFLRLSSILMEIIYSDKEEGEKDMKGGDPNVQLMGNQRQRKNKRRS